VEELIARIRRAGATGAVCLRADGGFWSHELIDTLRRVGVGYSITVRINQTIRAAIEAIDPDAWVPIVYPDSGEAAVAETTYTTGRGGKRRSYRLVVRRSRLTDPAQQALWPDWRYHGFVTSSVADAVTADRFHAGSARTPQEAATTTLLDVDGVEVALISYTYGFNGIPAPDGETWRSNLIDEARILADATTARQRGADVVVLALCWGDEYRHEPNAQQQALAPTLIRSPDIDLLLGHHAHVVQPLEAIDGEWVVYGMGNLVANQGSQGPEKLEGLLVRFTFTDTAAGWRTTKAEFAPLLTDDRGPIRVLDVRRAVADPATDPNLRSRLQQAHDRTTTIVGQRGATPAHLRPISP
jgi:hypothetical protein